MAVENLAKQWIDALNRKDTDLLLRLSDPEIEIVGPRGAVRGHDILRDWLGRAGATFATARIFARGDVAVFEQEGQWLSAETNNQPSAAKVASVLRRAGDKISSYARFDTLEAALQHAGLTIADRVDV